MGPIGEMMFTYRATNALLTNSGCGAVLIVFCLPEVERCLYNASCQQKQSGDPRNQPATIFILKRNPPERIFYIHFEHPLRRILLSGRLIWRNTVLVFFPSRDKYHLLPAVTRSQRLSTRGGHIVSRNYRMQIYRTFQYIEEYTVSNLPYRISRFSQNQ